MKTKILILERRVFVAAVVGFVSPILYRPTLRTVLSSFMQSWLSARRLFVMIVAAGLFLLAARPVTDPDVWWHLRTGQLDIQNHRLFHADPYSFTRAGQPWIDHEWLSEILIFALYKAAGWGGLIRSEERRVGKECRSR